MIRWFLIAASFAVLQISSSSESEEYFVDERNGENYTIIQYDGTPDKLVPSINESNGITKNFRLYKCGGDQGLWETPKALSIREMHFVGERNGKNYTITQYDETPNRLVLSINESNGITNHFNLSTCGEWDISIKNYSINNQGSNLYIHIWGTENDNSLVIVNLTALSNDSSNGNCTSIAASYFGKYKIYIYRAENSTILRRWLVASDGELTKPIKVVETEFPIKSVHLHNDTIHVNTLIRDMHNYRKLYSYKDAPKCDVPEDDTTCEEDQALEETPKRLFIPEEHFVGRRNDKNYTIIQYDGAPDRLVLSINESSGITKNFNLSTCGESWVLMKKHSINDQGSHLYIHIWDTENDNSLVIVNLTALSNNILNGNCTSIKAAYFGKHKIYVYRVEEDYTLKRWLVTPEGELTNPIVVAKSIWEIRKVDVSVDSININIGGIGRRITLKDAPKCDVPDDGTPCDDDKVPEATTQVPLTTEQTNTEPVENTISTNDNLNTNARATKRRRHIASTVEKTTVKSGDNSIVKSSEYDSNIGVVAIGAFIFVLVMILVGYFDFNSRSNSKRKPQNNPNKSAGNRKLIIKSSSQDKDCKVPMIV
ncbi:hypothetical protein FO519_009342 [Halicephalobus sp. NKZ332]|nr:hypothetical protein FO519_009342 [Halicephalobus sp. NKZ332]